MVYDSLMMARIASDLRHSVLGARVDRLFHTGREEIVLELRRKMPRPQIVISWSAEFGRVHMAGTAEPRPDLHFPVGDVLRKHLRGATLLDVRQMGFDRVLHLEFANCVGLGPGSRATLIAEIMGRHSNLILADEDLRITACAKHIGMDVNRYRETLPGLQYTPPPDFGRLDPHSLTAKALAAATVDFSGRSVRQFLRKALTGASDPFLDELIARADLPDAGFFPDPDTGWPARVADEAQAMLAQAEAPGPAFVYAPPGALSVWPLRRTPPAQTFAYPLQLRSRPELEPVASGDLSEVLEVLVASRQTGRNVQERRERLLGLVQRALKKTIATEEQRAATLAEADSAEDLRRRGELILANLHAIPSGAAEVVVTDYYDPDQKQVTLRLDPNHSARDNARAAFDRYKRARRIQRRVPGLLAKARVKREYLEGVRDQVEQAGTAEELLQLEFELDRGGHIGRQATRRRKPINIGEVRPARATSTDGLAIWFGRTGPQNDALLRLADGDDLWLHVREGPGGHVLIRTGGRPDTVPEATLRQAAALAAARSRWRDDRRADVCYTLARHVRKPPGAPPGFVTYTDFRTITVEPRDLEAD